ncbi:hypothetical protein ABFA07_016834 [Porites harrisoni]
MELESVNFDPKKQEVFSNVENRPSFPFDTIHISCKSDAYQGKGYNYAGVLIYAYNGKTKWETRNGTRCRGGYLVIKDTKSEEVNEFIGKSDGKVHGAVYRGAFGEEHNEAVVIGEGFAVVKGKFKMNSGVFNKAEDSYHDEERCMDDNTSRCVEKVVNYWKEAGKDFLRCQNFKVQDLLKE